MAKQHHPDKQRTAAGRKVAERRIKEINEAFTWLKQSQSAA